MLFSKLFSSKEGFGALEDLINRYLYDLEMNKQHDQDNFDVVSVSYQDNKFYASALLILRKTTCN